MAPRIIAALDQYGPNIPVVTLRSRKQAEALLAA
jgi:hypothetical protein